MSKLKRELKQTLMPLILVSVVAIIVGCIPLATSLDMMLLMFLSPFILIAVLIFIRARQS